MEDFEERHELMKALVKELQFPEFLYLLGQSIQFKVNSEVMWSLTWIPNVSALEIIHFSALVECYSAIFGFEM